MKKKLLLILMTILVLVPINTFAKEDNKYTSKDLKEVLKEEEIDADLKKYKENDKQITIYLFRGHGCGYCKKFLSFLSSIVDDYGKYFKLEAYEVWQDTNNGELFDSVATFLDKPSQGVPYIVIGDKVFAGFADSYQDEIKKEIKKLYDSKDRYDVLEEIEKKEKNDKFFSVLPYIIMGFNMVLTVSSVIVLVIIGKKKNKVLKEKMEKLEKQVNLLEKNQNDNKEEFNKKDIEDKKNKTEKDIKPVKKTNSTKKKKGETKNNEKNN